MAIPENQLETWSHQGSVTQSATTYGIIKAALEHSSANYTDRNFEVFLQGSYGNDTNIFAESDVDIVIRYDGAFYHNISELPVEQQDIYNAAFPGTGTYHYDTFKGHVQAALVKAFGDSVKPSKRAIKIAAGGSRRSADVLVAFQYRHFDKFTSPTEQSRDPGLLFFTSTGTRIANYPKQHSKNLTTKHQAASKHFKPTIRIFKNIRSKLVADGLLAKEIAPSYFIEGLLYNIPDDKFYGNYSSIVYNVLQWLHQTTDRKNFVCASGQHYLLRDNHPTCWPIGNGGQFINAATQLWNNW